MRAIPKDMRPIGKKLSLLIFMLFCCVGCDQATKELAQNTLRHAAPISLGHDFLRLQYVENSGGFLSFGATFSPILNFWLLLVLPAIFLLTITAWLLLSPTIRQWELLGLLLFVSGGVSNLVDRFSRAGNVIDFLNIGVGPLRTGIFNLADVAIMTGIGLWFFYTVGKSRC